MAKNYIEYQRSGINKAKFEADIRFAVKKHPTLAGWASEITPELGTLDIWHGSSCDIHTVTDDGEEILRVNEGIYQSYFKPTEAARARGLRGYNMIYEFTYDDEKTGHGYLYITEF